jgi:hypothetical protein
MVEKRANHGVSEPRGRRTWKRISTLVSEDPGQFAGGSAVVDLSGLLAREEQRLSSPDETIPPR